MRRRSIVLLAGGVLAVALAPPVFGAGDSTSPSPGQAAPTTTTTAPYTSATTASTAAPTTTTTASSSSATTATTAAPGMTTTTTAPDPATDSPAPSGDCPGSAHEAAPAEGESGIFPAGDAGEVEVSRVSPTELEVIDAVANDGWTAEIMEPRASRVKVRFTDNADTTRKVRFAAQMDEAGEEIHIRVSCS